MASLSDQIDRLSHNTRVIKATTAHAAAPVGGPFTKAVLSTSLGDLIRDIDPSELGLFSLPESEITRAEFTGATPLKKAPYRRDDAHKARDIEPEVYAQAALKCIDRYNAIRPMPRAHAQVEAILERVILVRENIKSLSETLQQAQAVEGPPLKSLIQEEDQRVRNLQSRLAALEERKKNLSVSKVAASKSKHPHGHPEPKPKPPPRPSSPEEDNFWNTPAAAARTLRFSDNLMEAGSLLNERVDLADISNVSFTSPLPAPRTAAASSLSPDDSIQFTPSLRKSPLEEAASQQGRGDGEPPAEEDEGEPEDEDESVGDPTVVLKKLIEEEIPTSRSQSSTSDVEDTASENSSVKSQKIKVNGDVERVATRIWTTIGDMIMPGHSAEVIQGQTGSKPPGTKEIIAHLQSLSSLSPLPTSPSVSSVSSISAVISAPTSQQILTAHLLISLLLSPPQFSLSLNKVKDLLAAKASSGGGTGASGTTRILYGCVAKRLLKIDRSGGEQIVKFDM